MNTEHGGNIYRYENITDFSANINPLGMPPGLADAVINSMPLWERYPDPECTQLRRAVSEKESIPYENIAAGNGADDLIYRLVRCLRPEKAVLPVPSFSEYEKALTENGCSIKYYYLREENNFNPGYDILSELGPDTDIVFVCTPNNPTGQLISPELLGKISETCLENDIILVCDECFTEFAENASLYSAKQFINRNTVILKAFTKLYAIPGLRLGYALFGSSALAEKVRKTGQYWSVSVPALAAGTAALKDDDYLAKTVSYVKREREYLQDGLEKLYLHVFPSSVNFILFKSRKGLDDMMADRGFLIRSCSGYRGLCDGFYRIAVRTHGENQRFLNELRRCLYG